MLFTYWTGSTLDEPPSTPAWRERFPNFSVFGDADVLPLLASDADRDLYRQITLPACKSDVARLVLLREYGGLYVDSHTGPANGDRLAETLEILTSFELILFSKNWEPKNADGFGLMNTVLAARRKAPVLDDLIARAFTNLRRQKQAEQKTPGHVPYNLFSLTGTMLLIERIFEPANNSHAIKAEFKESVLLYKMKTRTSPGFQIYQFYGYRKPGEHWSERQARERLFQTEP